MKNAFMIRLSYLLLLLSTLISAQSNRFYYELKFKPDTLKADQVKEFFITDINPKSVKFYSLVNYEYDSIYKKNGFGSDYPEITFGHAIKRERNSFTNLNYLYAGDIYAQMNTQDDMKWNVLPDTKMIGNIKVQAATTSFGKRQWTAWFTNSIPISEGPYKFRGLPGMILEVYDKDDYYHFTFVKNKKLDKEYDTSSFLENLNEQKPIIINWQKYYDLQQKYYDDPYASFKIDGINTYGDGTPVDFGKKTIEKQKEIKSRNNYIEKDFIIKYK